jgi:hypothetical protein
MAAFPSERRARSRRNSVTDKMTPSAAGGVMLHFLLVLRHDMSEAVLIRPIMVEEHGKQWRKGRVDELRIEKISIVEPPAEGRKRLLY